MGEGPFVIGNVQSFGISDPDGSLVLRRGVMMLNISFWMHILKAQQI